MFKTVSNNDYRQIIITLKLVTRVYKTMLKLIKPILSQQ